MPGDDKTEKATPKRMTDERKKGNVFTSKEINTLISLLAVFYTLSLMGHLIMNALTKTFHVFWESAASMSTLVYADMPSIFIKAAIAYGFSAFPTLLVAGLVGVIATLAQTKGLVSFEALKPKFSKFNPISGFKKMFSLKGLVNLLKSLVKITILAYVIFNEFEKHFDSIPRLMEMPFSQIVSYGANFLMDIVSSVALIFAFLAIADFMYERWQYEKDLRMSKQEIKEEYKQTEGDPQIKGKIKQKQREMAMSRMMADVPTADVVVRNPTHYAVALKYEAGKNRAPIVVAKGADLVALRIVKVAEENGVATTENKQLARMLYDNVEIDREIPEEFFQAVAEVLAVVYTAQKKDIKGAGKG